MASVEKIEIFFEFFFFNTLCGLRELIFGYNSPVHCNSATVDDLSVPAIIEITQTRLDSGAASAA